MLLRPLIQQTSRLSFLSTRTLLPPTRLIFPRFKMSDAAAASTQAPPATGDAPNLQKDPETGEMVSKS